MSTIGLVNIGFGNVISAERIIAVISPESAPVKRLISGARGQSMLIDATHGRRTRAVVVMDSSHVVLSAVQPETIKTRLQTKENFDSEEEKEERV